METQVKRDHYFRPSYLTPDRLSTFAFLFQEAVRLNPQQIVEIGLGAGVLAAMLRNAGYDVKSIDYAEDLRPDIVADVRDLSSIGHKFDMVVCSQVLEHLEFEDFGKAIRSLTDIAKRVVMITIPDRMYYVSMKVKLPGLKAKSLMFNIPFLRPAWRAADVGEHRWELNAGPFDQGRILQTMRNAIEPTGWIIAARGRVPNNPAHYFYKLERSTAKYA
jgi:2-polyprenyl-3-methyl-5-hydroxy-6-metoxy-1,4-benzoquinol methylase